MVECQLVEQQKQIEIGDQRVVEVLSPMTISERLSPPGKSVRSSGLGYVFSFQGQGMGQQRRAELQPLSSGTTQSDLQFFSVRGIHEFIRGFICWSFAQPEPV